MNVRWPRPLAAGDVVAGVAPSGPPDRRLVDEGVRLLSGWGLRVRLARSAYAGDPSGYLAASDRARLADLHDAFADPGVAGVCCLRGGYGSQRLLDHLDAAAAAANPKPFVGFSDVTALHVALRQRAGLVTFHGPSLQWNPSRLDAASAASLRAALFGRAQPPLGGEALGGGRVTAPLVGGNLTILSTLCGTTDQLDARGCVLFVEDVAERPYRVDRAFVHLRRAGVLEGVVGLVFDGFHGCADRRPGPRSGTVRELAAAVAADLAVPAVWGVPLGHGPGQRTVPLGGEVTVDGDAGTVALGGCPPGTSD